MSFHQLHSVGNKWSEHTNKSALLIERLGYDNFMSHLIHGYIFKRKYDAAKSVDGFVYHIPGDITKLIALYSPMVNELFIKSANNTINELKELVDSLSEQLSRKNQSLVEALYVPVFLTTVTFGQSKQ